MNIKQVSVLALLALVSCGKGQQRTNAVVNADYYGEDWIVAQDNASKEVYRCWTLHNVSIANEEHSDGIHWLDNSNNIVHISGWYNRITVSNSNWELAAKQIDVDLKKCHNG